MQNHLDPSESWCFLTIDPSWSLNEQTSICFRRTPQRSVHLRLVLQTAQRTSKEPGRQLGSKAFQNDGITLAEVHWWDTKGLGRGLEGVGKWQRMNINSSEMTHIDCKLHTSPFLESDSDKKHLIWNILIATYSTYWPIGLSVNRIPQNQGWCSFPKWQVFSVFEGILYLGWFPIVNHPSAG